MLRDSQYCTVYGATGLDAVYVLLQGTLWFSTVPFWVLAGNFGKDIKPVDRCRHTEFPPTIVFHANY